MEMNHLVNLLARVTLICDDDRPRLGRESPRRYGCRSETRSLCPSFDRKSHLGSPRFSRLASLASRHGCFHCLPEGSMCSHICRFEDPPHDIP
jgi:hypothetical protein